MHPPKQARRIGQYPIRFWFEPVGCAENIAKAWITGGSGLQRLELHVESLRKPRRRSSLAVQGKSQQAKALPI